MNSRHSQPPSRLTPQETRKQQRKPSLSSSLRFSNLCGAALLGFVIPHSSFVIAAPPPELTILRQQYEKVVAEKATAPFEANKAALDTKFTTALTNAIATAQQAGKLDDILAIQDDQKRLTEKLPIPDDDEKTPAALKTLRAIYREQLSKLETTRTAAIATVLPAYQTRLADLETTLTKAGRIDEAKELRTYREGLASGALPSPPATASAPSTPATTPGSSTPVPAAPKFNGDDRKAAEYLIKIGAYVMIDERGKRHIPRNPADLPKGKFDIISIGINNQDGNKPITSDDYSIFSGLQQLTSFSTDFVPVTDTELSFLATCPALQVVSIKRQAKITNDFIDHLIGLGSLREIRITDVPAFTGATLARLAASAKLEKLEFISTGFDDNGAENLPPFKKITSITLEGSKNLTDAGLLHLAKLPELHHLSLCNAGCTAAGLATARLKVEHLDFNRLSGKLPRETSPLIGPVYPNLKSIRFAQSESLTQADIESLAHFKSLTSFSPLAIKDSTAWAGLASLTTLETLWIDRNPFGDTEIDHLLTTPKIAELILGTVDVTDAGLLKLAGMKKLKRLSLKPCPKVTEAGIAALKKQRPDIQITR